MYFDNLALASGAAEERARDRLEKVKTGRDTGLAYMLEVIWQAEKPVDSTKASEHCIGVLRRQDQDRKAIQDRATWKKSLLLTREASPAKF